MKLKETIQQLKRKLAALYLAYRRKDTPLAAKTAAAVTLCYALSPIDLIPDFIPVLGYLDDAVILPLLIMLCVKLIPKPIMEQCEAEAEDLWKNGKPKKWVYAIPILLFWAIVILLILRKVFY